MINNIIFSHLVYNQAHLYHKTMLMISEKKETSFDVSFFILRLELFTRS